MNSPTPCKVRPVLLLACALAAPVAAAENADLIGLAGLRQAAPGLDGRGVVVAQPESSESGWTSWQVNPASLGTKGQAITWIASAGKATNFPNTVGQSSTHASEVASLLFGAGAGVAPGVERVENYESSYFYSGIVQRQTPIGARIVNQSFVMLNQSATIDQAYDNYAARFGTLFISGAGNSRALKSPATAYNGITVAAYGGASCYGPTADGRSKPDLSAPASATSFATPLVAGAAALLVQAAGEGRGGADTNAAAASLTIKALLLNGAEKPADWTNSAILPLDPRHGAGVLNVLNSYRQFRAGLCAPTANSALPIGTELAATTPATERLARPCGWSLAQLTSSEQEHGVHRYRFTVSSPSRLTATLVWQRQLNQAAINNLDLSLYHVETGARVATSASTLNNVEHLHLPEVAPGEYELVVMKHGGQMVSAEETYALAFEVPQPVLMSQPERAQVQVLNVTEELFQGRITGTAGQTCIIEATTDFRSWTPILTNPVPASGVLEFSDTVHGQAHRFYRAAILP